MCKYCRIESFAEHIDLPEFFQDGNLDAGFIGQLYVIGQIDATVSKLYIDIGGSGCTGIQDERFDPPIEYCPFCGGKLL